ncbi:transcription repressor OFP6-like [Camellia sinensis]|uniref:Transcription repressor n=1 Tax=Camellia sinensis var. sinensis TaxID=542762 RepID=A0A4S4DT22_CAMSN|nr:transcription repressor OFP6-like [Camellia sinensis]THG06392.1 hypothetical protein TEA_011060 [Camellia sinensis var. sinensis]
MSSNTNKRSLIRTIFTANGGCGCNKPKLSDIFQPKPKSKIPNHQNPNPTTYHHSSSSSDYTCSTTFSLNNIGTSSPHCSSSEPEKNPPPPPHLCSKMVSPCSKISDSVAVVKESDDPYLDFKNSMLQMISEREIYSKADLEELLSCFLQLNSPTHHEIIVRVFTEIWNGIGQTQTQIESNSL